MHRLTLLVALAGLVACTDDTGDTTTDAQDSSGGTAVGTSSGGPMSTGDTTAGESDGSTTNTSSTAPPETTTGEGSTTEEPPPETTGGVDGDVLQNDSWTPVDPLTWQTWASADDCWASVFSADNSQYPFELVGARAAIGGGGGVETFTVGVWEVDNQGMPTTEIDSRTFDVDGATTNLTDVDLTGLNVPPFMMMNQDFALVMCHTSHMGEPSIAIDADGTVDASRNWVFQQVMGEWVPSPEFFGTSGDFILRAIIMPI